MESVMKPAGGKKAAYLSKITPEGKLWLEVSPFLSVPPKP